jgi:hypothetical protein
VATDRTTHCIEVLLGWREIVAADGYVVPSEQDVRAIAASGRLWPPGIDAAAAEPWRDTVDFLLTQVKFGVHDPVAQLPSSLRRPDGAPRRSTRSGAAATAATSDRDAGPRPAPQAAPGPGHDPGRSAPPPGGHRLLTALIDWRTQHLPTEPTLAELKDHTLRNIVGTGARTESEIAEHLPTTLREVAARLAELIRQLMAEVEATPGAEKQRPAPGTEGPMRPSPRPATPHSATVGQTGPVTNGATPPPDQGLAGLYLADYVHGTESLEVVAVRDRPSPSGGTELRWPEYPTTEQVVLYRVVAADDEYPPQTPQRGDAVCVTRDLRCIDDRPFEAPVRYVQVWCHAGESVEAAADAEPVLHAQGSVVSPVYDAYIAQKGDCVVGDWVTPPGTEAVQVLRIPRRQARGPLDLPEYRILEDAPNLTGFVDTGVVRGERYVYQVSVEARVDGARRLSAPVVVDVAVSAVLLPVTDLSWTNSAVTNSAVTNSAVTNSAVTNSAVTNSAVGPGAVANPTIDIAWTPPDAGRVQVHLTQEPPAPDATGRPIDVDRLPDAGLPDDSRLRRPVDRLPDGREALLRVFWPEEWTRGYLTPVTVLDGRAAVGASIPVVRPLVVHDPEIVERTHQQVLTFAWPTGADVVTTFVDRYGREFSAARHNAPEEIDYAGYQKRGGLYFAGRLPPQGCTVHVVPVTFSAGRRVHGIPVTVRYHGLIRLAYQVSVQHDRAGQPVAAGVTIQSELDHPPVPTFALVHNPEWLPLHEHDGMPVEVVPAGDPTLVGGLRFRPHALTRETGPVTWHADVRGRMGYLRLFVCLPPQEAARYALLDPPIAALRLLPQAQPARRAAR